MGNLIIPLLHHEDQYPLEECLGALKSMVCGHEGLMRLKISFIIDKGSDSYVPVYARSSILMRQSTPKSGRMIWLHPGES